MNVELQQLYEADQTDRLDLPPPGILAARDRARRERVGPLLTSISSPDGDDFFHAGMIFQHGEQVEDYWRAHELALRAAELGHGTGRWLAAATYDRWLMQQGKPQKYGTQYRFDGERMTLWKVDPATTDHERAEWSVPSLAEAHARAERLPLPEHKALARLKGGELEVWIWPIGPDVLAPQPPPTELTRTVPLGHPAMWGWRPQDREPVLELSTIGDREAVLISGFADGRIALVMRVSNDQCLFLTDRSREEILTRAEKSVAS